MRYNKSEIEQFTHEVLTEGLCILRGHFPAEKLRRWNEEFQPLLEAHVERERGKENRGTNRYYMTLPFVAPFADEEIFCDADVLAIVENLVGKDFVMCQLATDTPLKGSDYQELHRDAPPLFPELKQETPPFQLAVNFPLVDVTEENGPFETTYGTHLITKEEGMRKIETGETEIKPLIMKVGDLMIRDVRGIHRGTPNKTDQPRPMCVIGYSRRWLFRPEVSIRIPRETWENLSEKSKHLLRFNPRVESLDEVETREVYQAFAY
ncbi:MAG: phytanoyl-CoA dioxygenase family protein [Acidobacteriota bacterium]|nr:phytanoyl-CoA dioxygenase family protein [Acidobacteriota bacterium]